jgi:uncharacterized protein YfaS (alpha-2-macroglobulin family)
MAVIMPMAVAMIMVMRVVVMIRQIGMRRINPLHAFWGLNRIQVRQIDSHSFSITSHQDLSTR